MSSSDKDDRPEPAQIDTPGEGDAAATSDQLITSTMHLTFNAEGVSEIRYRWQSSADGRSWTSVPGASNVRLLARQPDHGLSLTLALSCIFIDSAFSASTAHAAPMPAFAPTPAGSSNSGPAAEIPADMSWADNHRSDNSEQSVEIVYAAAPIVGSYDNGGQLLELENHAARGSGVPIFLLEGGPAFFGNGGLASVVQGDAIIQGGAGNDTLVGTDGDDTIFGGAGNDTISGGLGNDVIRGGAGDDVVSGDQGADKVAGDAGNDKVSGGEGDDTASGGAGNDAVSGGAGDDTVAGDEGDDKVSGDDGADTVSGGAGNDQVSGGAGDDMVAGGGGADTVSGGTGNDTVFGGLGDDTVSGGTGDDTVCGDEGADTVSGGAGDDTVYGGSGNDTVYGDAGDGTVFAGAGNDTVSGGAGDDPIFGDSGNDRVSGGSGNDAVFGGSGNDIVSGDAGDDIVSGDAGNDTVSGGTGNDVLYGGSGNDIFVYRYGDGDDSIMDFEDDHDELRFDGDDVSYEVNEVDYGRDYRFKDGHVLAVHGNSGKGSQNSGSDNSGSDDSDSDNSGSGSGGINLVDDEFDYSEFVTQSVYDTIAGTDGDDEWSDLVATGVYEAPGFDTVPVEDYVSLSDLYSDQGLHTLLGVSTITFSHEDHNLFG